jgi:NADP-dependent 3-hydroxy acid dehydrogenase YdfG
MRVIITGAASGIGQSAAELLAQGAIVAGDHKLLLVDRDATRLNETAPAPNASWSISASWTPASRS